MAAVPGMSVTTTSRAGARVSSADQLDPGGGRRGTVPRCRRPVVSCPDGSALRYADVRLTGRLLGHAVASALPRAGIGRTPERLLVDRPGVGTSRRRAPSYSYTEAMWGRAERLSRMQTAVAELDLPEAVFKTCPWQPRTLIETGLRQWLRCCGVALRDQKVIGMPSRAVDEAWHGLILCTARYSTFCELAYGRFLHHHPEGGAPVAVSAAAGSAHDQLRRTVIAWSVVAAPGEQCLLWDLDSRVGVEEPWGIEQARVAEIASAIDDLAARSR